MQTGYICSDCWRGVDFISDSCCAKCGIAFAYDMSDHKICLACLADPPPYEKAVSLFKFNDVSKKLIHKLKYYDHTYLAKHLAVLAKNLILEHFTDYQYIAPIPMHRYRLLRRFYNQSALLAKQIAKMTNATYRCDILIKALHTSPQASLTEKQRKDNVKNSFVRNSKYQDLIKGSKILLIDDVMTTGATVKECGKILLKTGVAQVSVFTLARTVKY